jgi:hypothetical protein
MLIKDYFDKQLANAERISWLEAVARIQLQDDVSVQKRDSDYRDF